MKVPAFWSKAIAEHLDRKGHKQTFCCWRCSDDSVADAHESALAAARRVVERLRAGERIGRYVYGDAPLRKETIQRFPDGGDDPWAVVTRNAYGVLVLNTARVMFIDINIHDKITRCHDAASLA